MRQPERASGAAAASENFAAIPAVVGSHWFQYYDHPKGGRPDGEDYDFGLVDINDRPYVRVTEALAKANRLAPQIHEAAKPEPAASDERGLPHATISLTDPSYSARRFGLLLDAGQLRNATCGILPAAVRV